MNVLFIQPRYPDTFWSLRHVLKFISKKAVYPSLVLMTASAMTPVNRTKKLVDLNVSFLKDEQIMWADMVFISAMSVQSESVFEVTDRCRSFNKTQNHHRALLRSVKTIQEAGMEVAALEPSYKTKGFPPCRNVQHPGIPLQKSIQEYCLTAKYLNSFNNNIL